MGVVVYIQLKHMWKRNKIEHDDHGQHVVYAGTVAGGDGEDDTHEVDVQDVGLHV